jgi:hypothetical protein
MMRPKWEHDRPGVALVLVLFVLLVVGAVSAAAALVGSNAWLINFYDDRQSVLEAVADAGLEEVRARINGAESALFPDSGYTTVENGVSVKNVAGATIPGVRRFTYVGPTGSTTGQYGVFGSIISIAQDRNGDRIIRRAEVTQESFARFAYFTDVEPVDIAFGSGDIIDGPVHSNDNIRIYDSGATFRGPVSTAGVVASGKNYATFQQGLEERAARIPLPKTAELDKLKGYAQLGNMAFTGSMTGGEDQATLRIEFIAIDLNGDGDTTDRNEGFIRVYYSNDPRWVVASVPSDYSTNGLRNSRNCGHYHEDKKANTRTFVSARDHPHPPKQQSDSWEASLNSHGRCYLGGSDSIFGEFVPDDGLGRWIPWPGPISPLVTATGRADSAYLFPISRDLNPNFRGVIYVDGKVAVSGVVRGHVTLAATGNIIIADDLKYATDPGSPNRDCTDADPANDDILGLFSGQDIVVADNTINTPTRPKASGSGNNYISFDDTPEETIHATILALNQFRVQNHASGPTNVEKCGTTQRGRGCLFLTGGVIQRTRGAVGTTNGTGYLKRYSYDGCVMYSPPPYFPTTGRFTRGRNFDIDPVGFDVAAFFDLLSSQ